MRTRHRREQGGGHRWTSRRSSAVAGARRRGRGISTAPTAPQPGNSGKFTQTMSTWVRAIQERRDNANRTRDLANKLNSELAAILQTCAVQDKALGQRSIRTQVQLSMAFRQLTGIVRQLEATRAVCAYLVEATQPQLPVVAVAALAGVNGANGAKSGRWGPDPRRWRWGRLLPLRRVRCWLRAIRVGRSPRQSFAIWAVAASSGWRVIFSRRSARRRAPRRVYCVPFETQGIGLLRMSTRWRVRWPRWSR